MKPPERIETKRLLLRKPRPEDAPAIYAGWTQDPDVRRYLTWHPHKRVEESVRVINRCTKAWKEAKDYPYIIAIKDSDTVSGMPALHPEKIRIGLGYGIMRAY